jgi:dihydroflavonol-4-reductase
LVPATHGGIAVIDVRDVVRMHIVAAEKGLTGEKYILCTANMTYREWFGMIADVVGVAKPIFYTPSFILPLMANLVDVLRKIGVGVPVDANQVRLGGRFVYFDGHKGHKTLGAPQITMRQSVEDTYTWYVEHGYIRPTWVQRLLARLSGRSI